MEEPPLSDSDDADDEDVESEDGSDFEPRDLDEPCDYAFKFRDLVWVRSMGGSWHQGRISSSRTKTSHTRSGMGTYYSVKFHMDGTHIQKDFAPLNGDIKPDTIHIRSLLKAGGWI